MDYQLVITKRQIFARWLSNRLSHRLQYDSPIWRFGMAGLLLFSTAAIVMAALGMPTGLGTVVDTAAFIVLNAAALLIASQLLAIILTMMYTPVPRLFMGSFLYVGVEAYLILYYSEFGVWVSIIMAALYACLGASIGIIIGWVWRLRLRNRFKLSIIAGAAAIITVFILQPFNWGDTVSVLDDDKASDDVASLEVQNPAESGAYRYRYFSYGNGKDQHRSLFAEDTELLSTSVDSSAYINKWPWLKQLFWGFYEQELPLNGRVWMPDGEGNFPLVLMVHGNHLMEDFSDGGYDYLGELLASRGFIAVSVDENFMNYSVWSGIPNDDMKVRAWLLLKHIQQIQTFSELSDSAFYQRVDFSNVALIGHSRGGQAVAMAADEEQWFSKDDSLSSLEDVQIQTVIALAPTDKKVDDLSARLTDVNYLTIQGARDGDVNSFYGDRQYIRTSFTPGSNYFKASLYMSEANHSRFNSDWGTMDERLPGGLILNQEGMMDEEDQRLAAQIYVSAFLESTLHGSKEYIPLFQDYRTGLDWLPDSTAYVNRFEDSSFNPVARYEEDRNKVTLLEGGKVKVEGIDGWEEADAQDRDDKNKGTKGVVLKWNDGGSYTLHLPYVYRKSDVSQDYNYFSFSMANLQDELSSNSDEAKEWSQVMPPVIEIELVTTTGEHIQRPLSAFMEVPEPFSTTFTTMPWLEDRIKKGKYKEAAEPVFQTYRLSLDQFLTRSGEQSEMKLTQIKFHFVSGPGKVMLDDIGFAQ
ncbi:MAG: alpha/beta hydrolase family protein [Candidatus Pristimantibacillus sp.]